MRIEQTLTSMEVAEMVGKEHKMLLRDLRRYIDQFNQCKIAPVEFFQESTYKDAKGESRPCYQVTKKGCEFIAHKLTGTKGTIFTARYINRFHEMEDIISEHRAEQPWFIRKFNGKYIILFRDFEFITGVNLDFTNSFWKAHCNELIGGLDYNGWGWHTTIDKREFNKKYGFNYGDNEVMMYFYPCGAVKALEILNKDRTIKLHSGAYETINKGIGVVWQPQNKRLEVKAVNKTVGINQNDLPPAVYEEKYTGFKEGFLFGIEFMQKQ